MEDETEEGNSLIQQALMSGKLRPPTPKPQDDVQSLLDEYVRLHHAKKYGSPTFRSVANAKTILRDVLNKVPGGKAQVMRMLTLYFNDDRKYYRDRSHALEPFQQDIQNLSAKANVQSKPASPTPVLRIRLETRCPHCGADFQIDCDANVMDKIALLTLCDNCTNKLGSTE